MSFSNVYISASEISNRKQAISSSTATVASDSNTGTGNIIGLYADYAGTLGRAGSQPGGITAENAMYGGVIR